MATSPNFTPFSCFAGCCQHGRVFQPGFPWFGLRPYPTARAIIRIRIRQRIIRIPTAGTAIRRIVPIASCQTNTRERAPTINTSPIFCRRHKCLWRAFRRSDIRPNACQSFFVIRIREPHGSDRARHYTQPHSTANDPQTDSGNRNTKNCPNCPPPDESYKNHKMNLRRHFVYSSLNHRQQTARQDVAIAARTFLRIQSTKSCGGRPYLCGHRLCLGLVVPTQQPRFSDCCP